MTIFGSNEGRVLTYTCSTSSVPRKADRNERGKRAGKACGGNNRGRAALSGPRPESTRRDGALAPATSWPRKQRSSNFSARRKDFSEKESVAAPEF